MMYTLRAFVHVNGLYINLDSSLHGMKTVAFMRVFPSDIVFTTKPHFKRNTFSLEQTEACW